MSTWSPRYSNGNALVNLRKIDVPVGIIPLTADQGSLMVHAEQLRAATPPQLCDFMPIQGATHYFYGQPEMFPIAVRHINDWIDKRSLRA